MPDFEHFIRLLLHAQGYEVSPAQIIPGKCVEHEIDAVAKNGHEIVCVEVKHHYQSHIYTGVGICLEMQATLEDLRDGFGSIHEIKFDRAMIVCNTKFSEHAKRYADCKGIQLIGWNMPVEAGLERMIEEKRLYPITLIKGLDANDEAKLGDAGIVLLSQLLEIDIEEIRRKTKIPFKKIEFLKKMAEEIMQ
jgi:hypothetical protein